MDKDARREELIRKKRAARRRKKRIVQIVMRFAMAFMAVIIIIVAVHLVKMVRQDTTSISADVNQGLSGEDFENHPQWEEQFLTQNEYSRPGISLKEVDNIYVHYVANPGTTAEQNRNYFNNLGTTGERMASSHFIIGLEGEIIQCVPLNEIAYAVKGENDRSISIECCHPTEDGSFTQATYDSLIELLGWLIDVYDLEKDDILRHYDSNGKLCPLYYVEHEDEWEQLKADVIVEE